MKLAALCSGTLQAAGMEGAGEDEDDEEDPEEEQEDDSGEKREKPAPLLSYVIYFAAG